MSSEVVVVLPCVPATATTRRPAITAASAADRGRTRRPRRTASTVLGVVLADRGRDDDGVGVADLLGRMADVHPGAELAQGVQGRRVDAVAAADLDAAGQHDPGDAGQPGAADADEVHAAQPVGRQDLLGDGHLHRAPTSSTIRATNSSASRGMTAEAAAPMVAQPRRCRRRGPARARRPTRSVSSASSTSRPPPASTTGIGVEHLLAVADRQRHEDGGQADRGRLGDAVGARPAHREVGGGEGEVHPVDVLDDDVGHVGRRRGRAAVLGPTTCSTCTPGGGERAGGRRHGLVEPARTLGAAGDQQRRPVRVEAEERAGLGAQGGAVEAGDHRADRQPDVLGLAQRRVREAHRTRSANRAPALLARPGTAFCSWTTIGTWPGGPRGRAASRRSRRSRRPRRGGPGRSPRGPPSPRRAAGPGPGAGRRWAGAAAAPAGSARAGSRPRGPPGSRGRAACRGR